MCGICGAIGGERGLAETRVSRMMSAMIHRGPDEDGVLAEPLAVLGMRRLSIIDLGSGRQPIYNEDGTVGVVFNGEIYNFPQLRSTLETCGHHFRTRSDTEVIVHAYEEWGERCLEHLRGMFAFALWDGRGASRSPGGSDGRPRVLLARDRLGIKPLYYAAAADGTLLFASEVRALLASDAIERRIEPESVEAYLLFGSVVEPMTIVKGVFSLPPGHALMVSCDTPFAAKPTAYWDLGAAARAVSASAKAPQDLASAARAVRPMLEEAVRSHLISDVPLGLFLSSGLDSMALAALASRERSGLHTFTVVFPELEFSEAAAARQIAARFGTEHRELLVTAEEMQGRLGEAVEALDQPSMDGINTFFVSWAARQVGLKVALSGLGGDEVFGGYPTFRLTPRVAQWTARAGYVPSSARKAMAATILETSRLLKRPRKMDALHKATAIWSAPNSVPHPYFFTRMLFTPDQIGHLCSAGSAGRSLRNGGRNQDGSIPLWLDWLTQSGAQATQLAGDSAVSCLELRTYMVDTLLRDTDAMSMHHSLEVRVPLLDHPLVEYVVGLPDSAKRRPGVAKALLVESLADLLPADAGRQTKRTFTFPWERWLLGPLGLQVAARLGDGLTPSLAAVLDPSAVEAVWRSFLLGQTGWARPWSLFVLNEWVRSHLDEAESTAEPTRWASRAAIP
jgi:asparagine synthase (glutamine-hydrolysing)